MHCRRGDLSGGGLLGEDHERRQRIVPTLGPHVAPDPHFQGRIGIERSFRVVADQRLISEYDQQQPSTMFAVIDDLAQYLEGVQDCSRTVPDAIADSWTGPAELTYVE